MVRMQIRGGVKWPVGIDFELIRTPGRLSAGEKGKVMKLVNKGCVNRPFYHIDVTRIHYPEGVKHIPPIAQVGTYDPLPNENGEKLCSLNLELITYYLGQGVKLSKDVQQLLGLAGFLPQSPHTYKMAWRNREEIARQEDREKFKTKEEES